MTRKERLTAVFEGKPVDRAAVKLWNVRPNQELLHPAYGPVYTRAIEKTDLVASARSPFHLLCGRHCEDRIRRVEVPTDSPEWVDVITTVDTSDGPLRSVHRRNTQNKPGYEMEHLLKEPADVKKLLSLPYDPFPFLTDEFLNMEAVIGDAGIVMYGLDHAMYGLNHLIGSENYALWSVECRELLLEATAVFAHRIQDEVDRVFAHGLRPVFGWVGPELCIPPLMSLHDFDEFVLAFDAPLCARIHDGGGRVWVHCHGRMRALLERFVEMGTDVLNPVEPPPMGDVTLPEAFDIVGNRMALEGNIETHDLMTAEPDVLAATIHDAVRTGSGDGRRFILCPTSGYMEDPIPSPRLIENLLVFIDEGVRTAELFAR